MAVSVKSVKVYNLYTLANFMYNNVEMWKIENPSWFIAVNIIRPMIMNAIISCYTFKDFCSMFLSGMDDRKFNLCIEKLNTKRFTKSPLLIRFRFVEYKILHICNSKKSSFILGRKK